MDQSKTLQAEEALKVEPYYTREDLEPAEVVHHDDHSEAPLVPIVCVNDWVVIEQDQLSSTIATTGDYGKMPTGTVLGAPEGSQLTAGDRVYFSARMIVEPVQHPAYPGRQLVVIQQKNVYFVLSA